MAEKYAPQAQKEMKETADAGTVGKGLVLSGSCSKATREQIRYFKEKGGRSLALFPEKLLSGRNEPGSNMAVYTGEYAGGGIGSIVMGTSGRKRGQGRNRSEMQTY